jgi:hypothetical protein
METLFVHPVKNVNVDKPLIEIQIVLERAGFREAIVKKNFSGRAIKRVYKRFDRMEFEFVESIVDCRFNGFIHNSLPLEFRIKHIANLRPMIMTHVMAAFA